MATAYDRSAFDRATDPIFGLLAQDQARAIVEFRGNNELVRRIEELASKCNEGELTEDERAEYEGYAHANRFIAVMQAKARRVLGKADGI